MGGSGLCMLWGWWFESRGIGIGSALRGISFVVVFRGIGHVNSPFGIYTCITSLLRKETRYLGLGITTFHPPVFMSPIPLADRPPREQTHNSSSREGRYYITTASSPARLHRLSGRPTTANGSSNTSWTRKIAVPVWLRGSSMTDHDGGRVDKFLGSSYVPSQLQNSTVCFQC